MNYNDLEKKINVYKASLCDRLLKENSVLNAKIEFLNYLEIFNRNASHSLSNSRRAAHHRPYAHTNARYNLL